MRVLMMMLLAMPILLTVGCGKASAPQEQAQETSTAGISPPLAADQRADIGLESRSGMTANLSYANAGTPAPGVAFTGAAGRDVHLSDFTGRPLLVNIWATWCAPCKAEMPTLDRLSAIEAGNVSVIAVSQDLEGRKAVQPYFTQNGFENLEPYTDTQNGLLANMGNNVKLPTTILYDSMGREVWRVEGGVEWDDAEMAKLISEAR